MGGKSHDRRSSTANQRNSSGRFRGHPLAEYSSTKIARGRRCENAPAFGNEQELNKSRFILNLSSCFSGFHNKKCYALTESDTNTARPAFELRIKYFLFSHTICRPQSTTHSVGLHYVVCHVRRRISFCSVD